MRRVRFRDPAGSIREGQYREDDVSFAGNRYASSEVDILPPVDPSKIVGVHSNYISMVDNPQAESKKEPSLFIKPPNTVTGHDQTVILPPNRNQITYEAELGVVIGKQCRNVSQEDTDTVIAGYTCMNEMTNLAEDNEARKKAFDNAAVIGPALVSQDLVPNGARIELRLNGEIMQDESTDQLYNSVPELIESITQTITLEKGDVIATGTPEGWGYLTDGDEVEIEIDGIGTLRHDVVQAE